jgi:hypothetical protein
LRYDDGSGTAAPSVAAAFELSYRRILPKSSELAAGGWLSWQHISATAVLLSAALRSGS